MTYDPNYPQYAPQPPPPQKNNAGKIIGLGCAGILAVLLLGGCLAALSTDSDSGQPADTTTTEAAVRTPSPTPSPTFSVDQRTMTELSVDIAWDNFKETDKDDMCAGVVLFGTDWAADQMRTGAGSDNLDWDYAAEIIQDKCEART